MARLLFLLLVLLAPAAHAAESAAVTSPRATVTLLSDTDAVAPGTPYRLALRLRMAPGWHTYWLNPGDAGVPPELALNLPIGVTAGPFAWPIPARQPEDTLLTYGYSGEVVLPLTVSGGPGPVTATASWLVCEKICVPEEGHFTLDLAAGTPRPSREAALFAAADARMPRPSPWPARIAPDGTLSLDGEGIGPDAIADAWFIPATPDAIAASAAQPLRVKPGRLALALHPAAAFHPADSLAGVLVLQDRSGAETGLAIAAMPGPAEVETPLLRILGLAFLGGLILNLMPCVFPVLAMKAVSLSSLSGQARGKGRRHAAAYAAGVLATFLAVAFVLLALRHAGSAAGWGFQFQSPVFVAAMACVLFAVGLNLSGVYVLGATVGAGQSLAGKQGLAGSFFAGTLAVLVATPCTAPFMGVAVTAGLAGSAAATVAVFAALGAGLAAPYALLASIPGFARALPRPGRWMDVLRQALAFPMYGAAVWMVWVLSIESGPPGVLAALIALTLTGFAAWALGLSQTGIGQTGIGQTGIGRRLARAAAVVAILAAVAGVAGVTVAEGPAPATVGTEAFSAPRLAALRAEHRPVFVNMTAAWCVTCLVNERVALSRPPVQAEFAAAGIAYLKGDWTRQDPDITAFLRSHGADGVPLYVFYPADGRPVVLPQILTPRIVLDAVQVTTGG